jgi:hypothetical protein
MTATADQGRAGSGPPLYLFTHYQYHSSGRLEATDTGWDTAVADSGPTRPPRFRHPQPSRSAARLFGLSHIPNPSRGPVLGCISRRSIVRAADTLL